MDQETFGKIDPAAFCAENLRFAVLYRKDVTITARAAITGESVTTITSGNHVETTNVAKPGDMLVKNPSGEAYLISAGKFASRYAAVDQNPVAEGESKIYRAVGGPMQCIRLNPDENVEFTAPWGETMRIKGRGVIVHGAENDIYGIQPSEFEETYRPCLPDGAFIPKDVWDENYRRACADAKDTSTGHRRFDSPRILDKHVEHTTWMDACREMGARDQKAIDYLAGRLKEGFLSNDLFAPFRACPEKIRVEIPTPGLCDVSLDNFPGLDVEPLNAQAFDKTLHIGNAVVTAGKISSGGPDGILVRFRYMFKM